ncbi:hypothetical protein PHSY_000097 [Pseudozyma hubeiensis SY62]|uniref:Rhodanese domain-containing protein n=1 Tax=Pseudozyma hubeiensis (strain SY62) TaxID=1305764 RepID=R9NVL8_PSEHS|nr:hypothetical protein PHSY_000097 [Pseudozyma hubeiensis SY62]GAC92543.1 hypothetical protein PHSY_000097 [Pseudozyma hubeiensis SY62]
MSIGDVDAVFDSHSEPSESVGSDADRNILAPYLALEEPRLVLDLRPDSAFHRAHLVNSYHISPVSELRSRYSYLPPRNTPFLVVADLSQQDQVVEAFAQVPSAKILYLAAEASGSIATTSQHVLSRSTFFSSAERLRLLRTSGSHQTRVAAGDHGDDVPRLLFRPSYAVRRTVLGLESDMPSRNSALRVLDLGCGAARDLAWILHGSRTRSPPCSWAGIGVDSWKAALSRAEQIALDLWLSQEVSAHSPSFPRCEKLLWAKCSDDGYLEPLIGSGKGKSVRTDADDPLLWKQCQQLGLSPLLPGPVESAASTNDDETKFDLVLCVRFHPRALLPRLAQLVRAGGIVLLSHFVTLSDEQREAVGLVHPNSSAEYDSPPHEGRIQPGEIEGLVEAWNQSELPGRSWVIESDVLEPIEDGRIIRSVALRKHVQ